MLAQDLMSHCKTVAFISVGNKKITETSLLFLCEIVILTWKQKDYQHVHIMIDSSHGSLLN